MIADVLDILYDYNSFGKCENIENEDIKIIIKYLHLSVSRNKLLFSLLGLIIETMIKAILLNK